MQMQQQKLCFKKGCNEFQQTMYQRRSHKPDADTIEVHFCRKGHISSVCPRITCCHLRTRDQPWVNDGHREGQLIHRCESCYYENSVVKVCKTCFEAAGQKQKPLRKLCELCLPKKTEINAFNNCDGNANNGYWLFRRQCLKPFEQCTVISSDYKRVNVRRVSDKKVRTFSLRVQIV